MFAIAFALTVSVLLIAHAKERGSTVYLITSFDFTGHPACGVNDRTNCIQAIRFYDADYQLPVSEVATNGNMTGQQSIVGIANVASIPRRVYAVTVYMDSTGRQMEGPRGQITELIHHASH